MKETRPRHDHEDETSGECCQAGEKGTEGIWTTVKTLPNN